MALSPAPIALHYRPSTMAVSPGAQPPVQLLGLRKPGEGSEVLFEPRRSRARPPRAGWGRRRARLRGAGRALSGVAQGEISGRPLRGSAKAVTGSCRGDDGSRSTRRGTHWIAWSPRTGRRIGGSTESKRTGSPTGRSWPRAGPRATAGRTAPSGRSASRLQPRTRTGWDGVFASVRRPSKPPGGGSRAAGRSTEERLRAPIPRIVVQAVAGSNPVAHPQEAPRTGESHLRQTSPVRRHPWRLRTTGV